VYQFEGLTTQPVKPYQQNGGPLLYFGGYSPPALDLCGEHCDVYLMWPEKKEELANRMKAVNAVAEKYERTLDYGLRVHMTSEESSGSKRRGLRRTASVDRRWKSTFWLWCCVGRIYRPNTQ